MNAFYFISYNLMNWFLLMRIFSYSSYHKYFRKSLLVLIPYSFLSAYIFHLMGFYRVYLYESAIIFVLLIIKYFIQKKRGEKAIENLISQGVDLNTILLSLDRTNKYVILSSITYWVLFNIAYTLIFNYAIRN